MMFLPKVEGDQRHHRVSSAEGDQRRRRESSARHCERKEPGYPSKATVSSMEMDK